MAATTAFTDTKGRMHKTPRDACLSNLIIVFGDSDGSHALANSVMHNRQKIEEAFREFDDDTAIEASIRHPDADPLP